MWFCGLWWWLYIWLSQFFRLFMVGGIPWLCKQRHITNLAMSAFGWTSVPVFFMLYANANIKNTSTTAHAKGRYV
ncbi:hypothetical protein SAMN05660479_01798 [Microbulbifer thermotolerans]|nr:hypothetical protein SAMN05660479_01798 [Microbulbifer thermotolerans]